MVRDAHGQACAVYTVGRRRQVGLGKEPYAKQQCNCSHSGTDVQRQGPLGRRPTGGPASATTGSIQVLQSGHANHNRLGSRISACSDRSGDIASTNAEVAERQTRPPQKRVRVASCGFESHLRHIWYICSNSRHEMGALIAPICIFITHLSRTLSPVSLGNYPHSDSRYTMITVSTWCQERRT